MLNRYENQAVTLPNPETSQASQTTSASDFIAIRPANAFGTKIGNEYVYETTEQHENNVRSLFLAFEHKVSIKDKTGYSLEEIQGNYLAHLGNEYNKGRITQNTYTVVTQKIGATQAVLPNCSRIVEVISNRYKTAVTTQGLHSQYTTLQLAVFAGTEHTVKLLLVCGVDPNEVNIKGETALYTATKVAPEMIPILIQHGAKLDVQSENDGTTALHAAALKKNPQSVSALLKAGAKYDILARGGFPAITEALYDLETLKAFIDNGVDINFMYEPDEYAVLHYALNLDPKETRIIPADVIRYLLEKGANPNLSCHSRGNSKEIRVTAFCYAVSHRPELIPLFAQHKADLNIDNGEPLVRALQSNNPQAFEELLKLGAHIDIHKIKKDINTFSVKGFIKQQSTFIDLLEKYYNIQIKKPSYSFDYELLAVILPFLIYFLYRPLYSLVYKLLPFEQWQQRTELDKQQNLDAARKQEFLNQLTKDIFTSPWQKQSNHEFFIELNLAANSSLRAGIIKTVKRFLEKKYGSVTINNEVLALNFTHPVVDDLNISAHKNQLQKDIEREISAIESPLEPLKKRLNDLDVKELADSKKKTEDEFSERIKKLQTEINDKTANNPEEERTLRKLPGHLKAAEQYEAEFKTINYDNLKAKIADAKQATDADQLEAALTSLEKQYKDETTRLRDLGKCLATKCDDINSELAKLLTAKKSSKRSDKPENTKEETVPEPARIAPPPAPPSLTPAPARKPAAAPTLFARAETKSTPKTPEVKTRVHAHAEAAYQYANNMQALTNDLFNAEDRKTKKVKERTQDIYLHGILYNLLRLVQSIWDIAFYKDQKNVFLRHMTTLRNILVHNATLQVGETVDINNDIVFAAAHLINGEVISTFEDLSRNDYSEAEINTRTFNLIKKLKLESLDLFSQSQPTYTRQECIKKIKLSINLIKEISAEGFETEEHVKYHLDKASAVKLLIVRIGEYFNAYCAGEQPNLNGYIEGIAVATLDECRLIRNTICHETEEKADGSHADISEARLLNLLKYLSIQRDVIEEEEEVPPLRPPM